MNKNRLEAFSDGVIAIIITIMVLEMKPPHGTDLNCLKEVLPSFFSYVQSFWFVGVYWNNHHHLMHTVKHVNGPLLVKNMLLLFLLSLVPFATNWVGESNFAATPVAVYGVVLAVCGFGWTIVQNDIQKQAEWSEAIAKAMSRQYKKGIISFVVYLCGVPLAFVNPLLSEALFISVAIMWLLPDKNIEEAFSSGN